MKRAFYWAIFVSLTGCSPFAEYQHLSDPRIDRDGYDLICGGTEGGDRISVHWGVCKNLHGGEFVKFGVKVGKRNMDHYGPP